MSSSSLKTFLPDSISRTEPGNPAEISLTDLLTPREQEIARLASYGMTNKEIGQTLEISHWTVATHMRRIFDKTNVNRRAALAIALAIRL
ncbi:MAG: response regulator transcription factor [Rhodobacteraceae bacterium]|nr:response regulator transcription factor [Paracoccaceae bacterium]